MVSRFVGVDSVTPKLPPGVITATQGTTAADLAAGAHTHAKADVGLGNVDNTPDASKPISTAQQAALDGKLNLAGGTLTGSLINKAPLYTDGAPILGRSADGVTARGSVTFGSTTLSISQPGAGNAVALVVNSSSRLEVSDTLVTALVPIQLPADPTASNHAATKAYVDAHAGAAPDWTAGYVTYDARYLGLAGGTVTGAISGITPTLAAHLTRKDYVDGLIVGRAPSRLNLAVDATTNRTLSINDDGRTIQFSAASAITVTVPPESTVAWINGTQINLFQTGAGKITVAPGSGVTIIATPSAVLRAVGSMATLIKTSTANVWLLTGDLA